MGIHYGECVCCGRGDDEKGIRIFDHNDQCIICTRIDKIQEQRLVEETQ